MLLYVLYVELSIALLRHTSQYGLEPPFFRIAGLHELMMLSVVAHELFGQGASDINFVPFASLGSIYTLSDVLLFFLGFDGFE